MSRFTRAGAATAAAVLVLGVAACGDDDDDATTDTTEAARADTAAFCDALIDFNSAVFEVDVEDASEEEIVAAGEQLTPLSEAMAQNAPAAVADQARQIDGFVQPLLDGDAEAFNADETFEVYTAFVSDGVAACGLETVEIDAVDYGFEGVPATLPAGEIALTLTNRSDVEAHEMAIIRRADGETRPLEELFELPDAELEEAMTFKAAAFAPPGGAQGSTITELEPGSYVMVCFIPVGGGEDGPPHFTQGMFAEFTVE